MKNISQINRPSLRDQVYQRLKSAIINLELEPNQRINDKLLAEKFGVSRTPVREALKRLEDEGLVISSPGSETKVSLIDAPQTKDAFIVVASLHALAARLAIPFLTKEHCLEMDKINSEFEIAIKHGNAIEAINKDNQFHEVILEASGNSEILVVLERLMPKIRRLELFKFNSVNGMTSVKQHQDIIKCIIEQDKNKIPSLLEENWLSLSQFLTGELSD
ncbi:GntR family transcriptional regulator [Priestia megaterium]|uniref:GntR family transcriptional regulator n=1 Tax=Priestia megaterium TaxID=1404 RepID=UPI002A6A56C9|nr:GntR family transcriptional regulator [Priestia megaterium]MDY0944279.1 GntR family transcriptional regulator [Priestia megaterium]